MIIINHIYLSTKMGISALLSLEGKGELSVKTKKDKKSAKLFSHGGGF